MKQQGAGRGMMQGHPMMMRDGPGRGGMWLHMMLMMMAHVGTDASGTLLLDEVQAVHARMFQYADTDDDGQLTAAGEDVTIHVTNNLPEPTSVHWHGLVLPYTQDGVPGLGYKHIAPGETFTHTRCARRLPRRPEGLRPGHEDGLRRPEIGR